MKKILNRIWLEIRRFLAASRYIWLSIAIAVLAGLIFGWNVSIWVFFGSVGAFIGFVFFRQIWWWIIKTGDYEDKNKKG